MPSYDQAQRLVDRLSDAGFPVEHVRLVGTDLRLVEQVTGRMTYGKAALYGAASGAWLGLLIGLLLGLFTVVGWLSVILWAVLLGAVWGLIFGLLAHARVSAEGRGPLRSPDTHRWGGFRSGSRREAGTSACLSPPTGSLLGSAKRDPRSCLQWTPTVSSPRPSVRGIPG